MKINSCMLLECLCDMGYLLIRGIRYEFLPQPCHKMNKLQSTSRFLSSCC